MLWTLQIWMDLAWRFGNMDLDRRDKTRDKGAKPGLVQWGNNPSVPTHLYTLSESVSYRLIHARWVRNMIDWDGKPELQLRWKCSTHDTPGGYTGLRSTCNSDISLPVLLVAGLHDSVWLEKFQHLLETRGEERGQLTWGTPGVSLIACGVHPSQQLCVWWRQGFFAGWAESLAS